MGKVDEESGTDIKDKVRSEGREELVVTRGCHGRDFVSGELSKLDGILSNRRASSIDEDPGVLFRRGCSTGLDQSQGPRAVKGLESRAQSVKTGQKPAKRWWSPQEVGRKILTELLSSPHPQKKTSPRGSSTRGRKTLSHTEKTRLVRLKCLQRHSKGRQL